MDRNLRIARGRFARDGDEGNPPLHGVLRVGLEAGRVFNRRDLPHAKGRGLGVRGAARLRVAGIDVAALGQTAELARNPDEGVHAVGRGSPWFRMPTCGRTMSLKKDFCRGLLGVLGLGVVGGWGVGSLV